MKKAYKFALVSNLLQFNIRIIVLMCREIGLKINTGYKNYGDVYQYQLKWIQIRYWLNVRRLKLLTLLNFCHFSITRNINTNSKQLNKLDLIYEYILRSKKQFRSTQALGCKWHLWPLKKRLSQWHRPI